MNIHCNRFINYRHRSFFLFCFWLFVFTITGANSASAAQVQPGDEISGFRLVQILPNPTEYWHWDMRLEVTYSYNPIHGKVIIGGYAQPSGNHLQTGHSYWGTSSGPNRAVEEWRQGNLVRGIQRINVAIRLNVPQAQTSQLSIFMYEPGGASFLTRNFDYSHLWQHPDQSSTISPATSQNSSCPKPYHVLTSDGRCVWSCGQGTQPDAASNECVCKPGYIETGLDQFGRRICKPASGSSSGTAPISPGASGPGINAGDAREGGSPDFSRLIVARDQQTVSVTLSVYGQIGSAGAWGSMVSVYLYGQQRHHLMIMFDSFQLRVDTDSDGHFERALYSGTPVRLPNGGIRIDIPRLYLPDIENKRIWAYSQQSRDRIPDQGELQL